MIDLLRNLGAQDLRSLAAAIRQGRVGNPFASAGLQRYVPPEIAHGLAEGLARLEKERLRPDHLALFLESLAEERTSRSGLQDAVDIVTTGPEAPGVANRDTAVVVRGLFQEAKRSVIVAGFAVYQGRAVFAALAERMQTLPTLQVSLFLEVRRELKDTSASSEILARFATRFKEREWPAERLPNAYYDPRALEANSPVRASLHAKCVVVDDETAFVTSANFTEAAHQRNIEVGVLLRSPSLAHKISHHFQALVESGHLCPIPGLWGSRP